MKRRNSPLVVALATFGLISVLAATSAVGQEETILTFDDLIAWPNPGWAGAHSACTARYMDRIVFYTNNEGYGIDNVEFIMVPEPSSFSVLCIGALGLFAFLRKPTLFH